MSIEVRYRGGLGNNLFQYAFGRLVAEKLGRELVCVEDASSALSRHAPTLADAPQHLMGRVIEHPQLRYTKLARPLWDEHGIDLDYLYRAGGEHRIILSGYFQRTEHYWPHRERIRRWYAPGHPGAANAPIPHVDSADVIVHIRRGDYFEAGSVVSMRYYETVLDTLRPRRVFVTGVGIDDAVRAALARFDPQWLELDPLSAMWTLARFNRIVGANSTFSWWGAFLSDASEIYFPRPVAGFWSRETARIALEVDDPRYHYLDGVETEEWRPYTPGWTTLEVREPASSESGGWIEIAAKGQSHRIRIDENLLPLCTWLSARSAPFGYVDVAHLLDGIDPRQLSGFARELMRVDALSVASA